MGRPRTKGKQRANEGAVPDHLPLNQEQCMTMDLALMLTARTLWTAVLISAPMLLTALLVGLLISIFQVVTQIQEMSLTFVPKLLAVAGVMVVAGPWMLRHLASFATSLFLAIPSSL
jgi:flagellar biosynthetic protein FliQ